MSEFVFDAGRKLSGMSRWCSAIKRPFAIAFLVTVLAQSTSLAKDPPKQGVDQIRQRLQYLGEALQKRNSTLRMFAPGLATGGTKNGAKLSWRVHLLPFIGEPELYEDFYFDEPWDGPHNKLLLSRIPAVYSLGDEGFKTRFQVFAGDNLLFSAKKAAVPQMLSDGPAKTIMIAVTSPDKAVPWTQPDDLEFIPDKPAQVLGNVSTIECLMADGALASFPAQVSASDLAAFITPAGSESAEIEKYLLITKHSKPDSESAPKKKKK